MPLEQDEFEFLADRFKFDANAASQRGMSREGQETILLGLQKQREMDLDRQEADQQAGAASTPFDTFRAGLNKGAKKVILGGMQLGSELGEKVGLVSPEFNEGLANVAKEEANEPVFNAMREQNPKSALAGEIGGEVGLTLPALVGGPATVGAKGGVAAGRGAFAGRGAIEGAAIGALQPVQDRENFAENKLIDTAIGASVGGATGALAPEINQFLGFLGRKGADVINGLGAIKNKLVGAGGKIGDIFDEFGNMTPQAEKMVLQEGIDPEVIKQSWRELLKKQKDFQAMTTEEQARAALFESQGITPDKGSITRKFEDQEPLLELRKSNTDEGQEARNIFAKRESGIRESVDRLKVETGGQDFLGVEDLGGSLSKPAREKAIETQKEVSKAYDKVRETIGDQQLPKDDFLAQTDEIFENFDDFIPSAVTKKLKKFSDGERDFNINEAEKFRKQLGTLQSNATDGNTREGLRQIKQALDDTVSEVSEGFSKARTKASERFSSQESAELRSASGKVSVDDIIKGKIPDEKLPQKLISKSTTSKDFGKIIDFYESGTKAQKEAGKQAKANLKKFIIETVWDAATKNTEEIIDGVKGFSGKKWKDTLDAIGRKKLERIFSKNELKTIGALTRIGELTKPLSGTSNKSGTSASLINFLMNNIGRIPTLGGLRDIAAAGRIGAEKRAREAVLKQEKTNRGSQARKQKFRNAVSPTNRVISPSASALALELKEGN